MSQTKMFTFIIARTKTLQFKVYAMDHHPNHLMNWRGCNFRFWPILPPDQPRRGYETYEEALKLKKEIEAGRHVEISMSESGQYLPDSSLMLKE